ncbi:MAG TPA: sigma-54 dependent transcriptional regulator [Candidatus Kapabacteria bacterium]|nr:sigma-54 dependent transcriptional regulator [Candidatus Kapabacteria bacterium]
MKPHFLIIDDEPNILKTMSVALRSAGYDVTTYPLASNALTEIEHSRPHYTSVFIDLMMHPIDGLTVLRRLQTLLPDVPSIIITAHGTIETAVEALKLGAYDYLQKPFDQRELLLITERVIRLSEVRAAHSSDSFLTNDPELLSILKTAEKIAPSDLTVLIEGETGTGKELIADFIHRHSIRSGMPIIKLNCAALSPELIESELFGHAKGSFTSAIKDRVGLVEAANGGTLFLDEIGEMPTSMQAKMLRFLQNREFQRVGENNTRTSDVRIVAATNRNLEQAILEGTFREDLFYRLSAFRILVPPLRHRKDDIILLAEYFIIQAAKNGLTPEVSEEVKSALLSYEWRGNVRELENVMIRASVLASGERQITLAHLPEYIAKPRISNVEDMGMNSGLESLEEVERKHITAILSKTTSLEEAARILGIDSATLWRKRKKYGL